MKIGGGRRGGVGVLLELGFEGGGAIVCGGPGVGSVLGGLVCLLKARLEPGDPLAGTLCVVGRRGACLFELGRELVGAAAVLGGFRGGDVDERLQVA